MTRLYSPDPTQRGDEIAEEMRDYYEANKPLHWWQRRRVWAGCHADNLMIGLQNIVLRAEHDYAKQIARIEAGTDETRNAAQPVGREPDQAPKGTPHA